MRKVNILKTLVLGGAVALLSACSNGGELTLETGAFPEVKVTKGSPFVTVNQGGKALIIEQGKTVTSGVHGYVTVQAVTAKTLASATPGGPVMILNNSQAQSAIVNH